MVGNTKTSLTNDLKHQNKSRERGQKIGRRPFRNNQGPVTGTSRGQSNGVHDKTHWRENPVTLSIPILYQNINTAAARRSKFGVEAKPSIVWGPHLALIRRNTEESLSMNRLKRSALSLSDLGIHCTSKAIPCEKQKRKMLRATD